MRRALLISLALAALGAGLIAVGDAEPSKAASPGLERFGSCGQLLGYMKEQAKPLVGPWGIGGGLIATDRAAGAPESQAGAIPAFGAGVDYSTTNVQERGVDEPDLVKSNGRFLYIASANTLRIVDVRARTPRLASTLKLGGGGGHELLLHANRLLVLTRGGAWIARPGGIAEDRIAPDRLLGSSLTEIDVTNPSAPRVVRTLALEGNYLSARLVGGSARVVVTSPLPRPIPFEQPKGSSDSAAATATTRNRAILSNTGLAAWLPNYELRNARGKVVEKRPLVQCRNVSRPVSFSGLGMMTVLTIDLLRGLEPVDSDALVTDGQIVYGSPSRLYVATQRWIDRPIPAGSIAPPNKVTTAVHAFDISDPFRTHYRASGVVSGHLLSQWSMSEHQGVLRVASTEFPTWWQGTQQTESESFVTTLRERGDLLVQSGRVGGLGRGERVYAVRFIEDKGYVVTFRQVDPLYTLDLSDPATPRVRGELKILGYSAYLHPLGGDLLLGVGQDATDEGRVLGTQLSLFDVSNPKLPKRLHKQTIGGWSEAEWDHHAFLYWVPERLAVLPTVRGASGFKVGRAGIQQAGVVEHPTRRTVVVRGTLYTVSEVGVQAADLRTFSPVGAVPFPPMG